MSGQAATILATPVAGPWPLALYAGLVVLMVVGMLAMSHVLGQRHRQRATGEPYESGMVPTGSARLRFPASFYLMAMFFVVFDLEIVLFVSWAIAVRQVGWAGFAEIVVVGVVLLASWLYLLRRGALDWGTSGRQRLEEVGEEEEKADEVEDVGGVETD